MAVIVPDIADIFEEAYERAGLELRSGYDLKTARRSLNILTLEWQNRGLNLFTVEEGTIPLISGTSTYTLPDGTIDVIEHQLRTGTGTNQLDTNLDRISVSSYAQQANKNQTGRPTQIYVDRGPSSVSATLWPIPDSSSTYTLFYYRLKGIDGVSSGIADTIAIPPRFIPCLISGLAYYIAMKKPELAQRVGALKQEYEMQFELAAQEDRDRSSVRFVPFGGM